MTVRPWAPAAMSPDQRLLGPVATLVVAAMLCFAQPQVALAAQWGSSYGDPPGSQCPPKASWLRLKEEAG
jgi:hypothetical protein